MGSKDGASLAVVRDSTLIIFVAIYVLRPSGTRVVRREHAVCGISDLQVLVGSLKGKSLQEAMRKGGRNFYFPEHSPGRYDGTVKDLILIWSEKRGASEGRRFDTPGLAAANLNRATKQETESTGWTPPNGC